MKKSTKDRYGNEVFIGSRIRVLEIDSRITEFLPEDEVKEINTFLGNVFDVIRINSDGSMLVNKEWIFEEGHTMSHEIAIFSIGAVLE